MTVFIRYNPGCREVHYQPVWEAKTGNILTRSTISKENFVFGGVPLTNIEYQHYILRDLFLKAFPGIAKDYYRKHNK